MYRKELCVLGVAIVMVTAVVMFFPVTGTAGGSNQHRSPMDIILDKLDNIPPAWSQKLPAEQRFILVLDDAAVLDKETGLVWEREVSSGTPPPTFIWYDAVVYCTSLTKGGRSGWHLPAIEQLASLLDRSVLDSPKLPEGHPFIGVRSGYWSSTSFANDVSRAWLVGFNMGVIHNTNYKTEDKYVWCVRGGQSAPQWSAIWLIE